MCSLCGDNGCDGRCGGGGEVNSVSWLYFCGSSLELFVGGVEGHATFLGCSQLGKRDCKRIVARRFIITALIQREPVSSPVPRAIFVL